jgi:glycosyltransferase involved in cell wall biosynthesis
MRILVVCQELPPVGGGGGRAAFELARQWARRHEVDYITEHVRGLPVREVAEGVRVHRVFTAGRRNMDVAPTSAQLLFPVAGFLSGLRQGSSLRYDVVNSHFAVPSGPLGLALAAAHRAPHVASIHGADIYEPCRAISPHRCRPVGLAVRWVLSSADLIVAQSTDTAGNALAYYGDGLAAKMHVIPLPFDMSRVSATAADRPEARAALGLDADARYLLSIGRLVRRKGFGRLVRALGQLPDDVRLLIIGSGPLGGELDALIRDEGLGRRACLLGRVSERDKYSYLAASDLYVLSSEHEGFGIVLQEAMAVGLPIVATSHGGQADLLQDGTNAILVDSNDPAVLAGAVNRLLEDPRLCQAMSRANLSKIAQYGAPLVAERYVDLFRQAVEARRTRTSATAR